MTLTEFSALVEGQRSRGVSRFIIPVYRRLSADLLTPVSAFLTLRAGSRYSFLLESVEGGEKLARYSFLGRNPYRIVKAHGTEVLVEEALGDAGRKSYMSGQGTGHDFIEEAPADAGRQSYPAGQGTEHDVIEEAPADAGRQSRPSGQGAGHDEAMPEDGWSRRTFPGANVFKVLQRYLDAYEEVKIPGLPRFTSGAVGYLGYDAIRLVEHLPDQPGDDLGLPDAMWCFYDTFVAIDHVKHQLVLMSTAFVDDESDADAAYEAAVARLSALTSELAQTSLHSPEPVTLPEETMRSNFARADFERAVEKAKNYIYEGDIFQVVLSQRFSMRFTGDRLNLYRALRQVNPSPYLFYLDFDEFALIGSSPEVLVRVEDGRAELLPIAGTRRRGGNEAEDRALEMELLADPKERAEHLMLVDLGRNDLGRVCRFETVSVDRYAFVERYSHVMHIVSSVSGLLDRKRGAMDVLSACFPAGTVSGAPKVRAMEIIDELEPTKRGAYAGAVGHVDFSGNMDTCIAIRTMLVRGDTIYVQAGAGIVADSDPAMEFEETENKARALKQAILMAAEGLL